MSLLRVQSGDAPPIIFYLYDVSGVAVTGETPSLHGRRTDQFSTDYWTGSGYDSTPTALGATEVDATNSAGEYQYTFDTSSGAVEQFHVFRIASGFGDAVNIPQFQVVAVGGFIDNLDATVSSRSSQATLDVVSGDVAAVLVDTGTDIPARFDGVEGAGFLTGDDSLEAIRDRGDTSWLTAVGFSTHSAADAGAAVWNALMATHQVIATTFGGAFQRILAHAAGRNQTVSGAVQWTQKVYYPDNLPTLSGTLADEYNLKNFADAAITDAANPVPAGTVAIAERDET